MGLLCSVDPKCKTSKAWARNLPDGSPKPPCLLIVDGDEGQVMALFASAIFERLFPLSGVEEKIDQRQEQRGSPAGWRGIFEAIRETHGYYNNSAFSGG